MRCFTLSLTFVSYILVRIVELASKLESDLHIPLDWSRERPVDFNAGKIQLVSFDLSNNTDAIDVKMDGSVLEENSSFKMLVLTFSSKLD